MPRVLAVLGGEAALGFALTGMEVLRVRDQAAARLALREAAENAEAGLVIVEEALLAALEPGERERLLAGNRPLMIPVRMDLSWVPEGQASEDDYVAKLIRHAVGYQLNIQL
jgi:vacuolar-type H+-ATPase subunit F/Vma7